MRDETANTLVQKFGGTSVEDAEAIRRVVSIVQRPYDCRRVVVVSACSGVTTMLQDLAETAATGISAAAGLRRLLRRHIQIAEELFPDAHHKVVSDLEKSFMKLA